MQQTRADTLFELAHSVTQRRRRYTELACSSTKAFVIGYGDESGKISKVGSAH
jgi:hypothetical protein